MDMKPEELLTKLNTLAPIPDLPRIFVIYGEDDYYRQSITRALPDYVYQGVEEGDRSITSFERDTDLNELANVINTYPFFSGSSLVIIKDEKLFAAKNEEAEAEEQKPAVVELKSRGKKAASDKLERLVELFSDVPDYCTIVISVAKLDKRTKLFKALKKSALLCECISYKTYEIGPWLDEQAERYGAHWQRDAIGTLMEYLAPVEKAPLGLLRQEIAKLALYAGDRHSWSEEDVKNIFSALPEASNFALINFISERKLVEALELLAAEKKKNTNILPICALVLFKLRQLLQFMERRRSGYDMKAITAEMKLHPYAARKMGEQVRRFSEEELRRAVVQLADLNVQLRYGGRDYARLEEILIQLLARR